MRHLLDRQSNPRVAKIQTRAGGARMTTVRERRDGHGAAGVGIVNCKRLVLITEVAHDAFCESIERAA